MSINKQWFAKVKLRWHTALCAALLSLLAASSAPATTPFPHTPLLAGTGNCDIGPVRSSSGLTLSSRRYKAGVLAFHASYQAGTWSGDVIATDMTTGAVRWQLSKTFSGVNADFKDRPIWWGGKSRWVWSKTGRSYAYPKFNRIEFTVENRNTIYNPNKEEGGVYFNPPPPSVLMDEDTFYWLRGDQSKEDGIDFRIRIHPIGDIVHSIPAYAAGKTPGSLGYVYVGANDGMLHGIDADNGKVLFSYIPRGVTVDNLVTLKDPDYEHRFFVDGYIDALSPGERYTEEYIVLGALGRGGRGIFALDASDPENVAVIFDGTVSTLDNESEPDVGYLLGPVSIGITYIHGNYERIKEGYGIERPSFYAPNGINSPNDEAKLLMLGDNVYVDTIDRSINHASLAKAYPTDGSKGNGLLAIAMMRKNYSDSFKGPAYQYYRVYGGDLKGNIWVWEREREGPIGLEPMKARKVFEGDPSHPVTGLTLARNADGQVVVGFGTGSYAFEKDRNASRSQRLYSIIDDYQTTVKQADLTRRSLNGPGAVPVLEPYSKLPANSRGWYIDLAAPEQVTHAPVIIGSGMYVNLVSPPITSGLGCDQVGQGQTRTVAVNIFTGTAAEPQWPYFPGTSTDGIIGEGMATTLRVLSDDEENGKTYLMTNIGRLDLPKPVEGVNMGSRLFQSGRLQWREIVR